MSVNHGEWRKPPVSDVAKERPSLTANIETILSQTENTPPPETLSQLAKLTTPENSSQPTQKTETPPIIDTPAEVSPEPKPIIHNIAKKDQKEIAHLNQIILNVQTTEVIPQVPPPKTYLKPTLYEQYHQKYESQRKTLRGAITRAINIHHLTKTYGEDMTFIYDEFSARGFTIKEILQCNLLSSYSSGFKTFDRLDAVGLVDKQFIQRNNINYYDNNVKFETDHDFEDFRTKLAQFPFLSKSEISFFLQNPRCLNGAEDKLIFFKEHLSLDSSDSSKETWNKFSSEQIRKNSLVNGNNYYTNEQVFSQNYIGSIFESIKSSITPETLASLLPEKQLFWKSLIELETNNPSLAKYFIFTKGDANLFFDQDGHVTISFFEALAKSESFNPELFNSESIKDALSSFSMEDQKLWGYLISSGYINNKDFMSFLFSGDKSRFIKNGEITQLFYKELADKYPLNFINIQDKSFWKLAFGDNLINELLDNLPKSSDEKRNAFTHNQYDRTSKFFKFLYDHSSQTNFRLDTDHIQIASEYIKNYGLSESSIFYNYFQSIYFFQQGKLNILPNELTSNHITSTEELTKSIKIVQKKCFSVEPITNVSELTPFELNLLSIITGHSANIWTRIPLKTIISDFSHDISKRKIAPLPSGFHPETINSASISIETGKKISDSPKLTALSQEILASINSPNDVSPERTTISELFNQRIESLSQEVQQPDPTKAKKQEFIQKQINAFKQKVSEISKSQSIDQLIDSLVTFNFNLSDDQEKFNSVLRQLVFKKVFDKHQNSPGWQENIAASLRSDSSTVDTVNSMINLISNTIKDHVLNFETKNQDGYWNQSTFETVKKYSSVFKKNLGFPSFINELNSYRESFITTELSQDQTIQMVPDRGLIGEMSGYMANVCYTKVYPLLKQYPDLVPYKFIANPESKNPEFIGSTLVFKVKDVNNQPVFLIRAFDIPNEKSVDVGKFFESFVEHLTPIAKKMGIKKIIAAGTGGTISNYATTINYVLSNYVTDKTPVRLRNKFDFNGYNITKECYQIRDLK